jgi:L-fucose isomerase-like protein
MAMPTEEELKIALAEAGRMREQGEDPYHIAKALLNSHYQQEQLRKVLKAVEQYFHSGMAVQEHQKLRQAMDKARVAIDRTAGGDTEQSWLR